MTSHVDMVIDILWDRDPHKATLLYSPLQEEKLVTRAHYIADALSELPKETHSAISTNLQFLHFFCGHQGSILRALLSNTKFTESSKSALKHITQHLFHLEKTIAENNTWIRTLTLEPPEIVRSLKSFDGFLSKITETNIASEKNISPSTLFDTPTLDNVVRHIQSTTLPVSHHYKKLDLKKIRPEHLCTIINFLRQGERGSDTTKAEYIRAEYINLLIAHFLTPGIFSKEQKPVQLDSNGLFIQIRGLSTHIPYGLLQEEALHSLKDLPSISREHYIEIELQRAFEMSAYHEFKKIVEFQARVSHTKPEAFSLEVPISSSFLFKKFQPGNYAEIFSCVDSIASHFAHEDSVQEINTEKYYNTIKIAKALINASLTNTPEYQFFCIRSESRKNKDGSFLSFLEVLYRGKRAKILLNISKHLQSSERVRFQRFPVFDHTRYTSLSHALDSLSTFSRTIEKISKAVSHADLEYIQHFILTNTSSYYPALQEALAENPPEYTKILTVAHDALQAYIHFLYKNIQNPEIFDTHFNPKVQKIDLVFDQSFLTEAEKNLRASHYDPSLFTHTTRTRVVALHYTLDNPSSTVPFHIEEAALDALRLHHHRPLINVIGGSKFVTYDSHNPFIRISKDIVNTAHAHCTNIAVPGTQSGIGLALAQENVAYKIRYSELSHHKKAHMFSITPGGNCFFPDNPFLAIDQSTEHFALSPVDSIITPYPADWNIEDSTIRQSRYFTHIAYMESLCARISSDKKHVVVLANGGLFSLAELEQLLKQPITLVLLKESGRLASILSALFAYGLHKIPSSTPAQCSEYILNVLPTLLPTKYTEEFFEKDFGTLEYSASSDRHKLYRELFTSLISKIINQETVIHSPTIDDFGVILPLVLS